MEQKIIQVNLPPFQIKDIIIIFHFGLIGNKSELPKVLGFAGSHEKIHKGNSQKPKPYKQ